MSTATTTTQATIDHPHAQTAQTQPAADFALRLRTETTAVRFRRRVLGNTRALRKEHHEQIAEQYHADPDYIKARKKLLNRKDPRIRECFAICERACEYWESLTVPYSEGVKGIRLIRRDRIAEFENGMRRFLDELADAVAAAELAYHSEIIPEARARLEELFDASDYPATLEGCWGFDWEYPSVEPPVHLQRLHPELFEAEQRRVRARFEEAVRLTEEAFTQQFAEMVGRLSERLQPDPEGKTKRFEQTTVSRLTDFFDRFRSLSIGSNAELDALVGQAQQALEGVDASKLRKDVHQRQTVQESMAQIFDRLTEMMVDKPQRLISLEDDGE